MYHEPFGPEGTENEHSDFWTDIPEGSDMIPGVMPGMMPGDAPEQRPDIRAQGDGSGMADWDADGEVAGNFEPGSRQSTEKAGDLPGSQDCDRAGEPDNGL